MKKLVWNSKSPDDTPFGFDWNQTIVTKLNQMYSKFQELEKPIKLTVPKKFESIINSLFYYDKETKTMSDIYVIEYIESDINYISFENVGQIIIKNFKE